MRESSIKEVLVVNVSQKEWSLLPINDALDPSSQKFDLLVLHIPVPVHCPKSNLINDKVPVLGLDIVEPQV